MSLDMDSPIKFLKSIEFQPADVRKNIILNSIKKLDKKSKFSIRTQDFDHKKTNASNIIVSLVGNSEKKIVIGAHYDIWPKSGGINDNGAAVLILLELIKFSLTISDLEYSIDFAFFDLEEKGQLGAKEYLKQENNSNIIGMINLDMCGIGDYVIFNETPTTFPQLSAYMIKACIENDIKHKILTTLPPGDEIPFQKAGINSVSLAIVPEITLPIVERLAFITQSKGLKWARIKESVKFMFDMIKGYPLLKTMHSSTDTIDTISNESMEKVYLVVQKLLVEINLVQKKG